jgi:glycerol kinase
LKLLKVDGGAVTNNYLMQFQADILGAEVERPVLAESTAQGAAYLAGLECGLWTVDELKEMKEIDKVFNISMDEETRKKKYELWKKSVQLIMTKK